MVNTVFASHRAQIALFEYIILLFAASILFFAIMTFKLPQLDVTNEVYSCLMSSYYGKVICEFPKPVKIIGYGSKLIVDNKSLEVPHSSGKCYSNKIIFYKGEVRCSTH